MCENTDFWYKDGRGQERTGKIIACGDCDALFVSLTLFAQFARTAEPGKHHSDASDQTEKSLSPDLVLLPLIKSYIYIFFLLFYVRFCYVGIISWQTNHINTQLCKDALLISK